MNSSEKDLSTDNEDNMGGDHIPESFDQDLNQDHQSLVGNKDELR